MNAKPHNFLPMSAARPIEPANQTGLAIIRGAIGVNGSARVFLFQRRGLIVHAGFFSADPAALDPGKNLIRFLQSPVPWGVLPGCAVLVSAASSQVRASLGWMPTAANNLGSRSLNSITWRLVSKSTAGISIRSIPACQAFSRTWSRSVSNELKFRWQCVSTKIAKLR